MSSYNGLQKRDPLIALSVAPNMTEVDSLVFSQLHDECSDIYIQPGWWITARIDGVIRQVSENPLSENIVTNLVSEMTSVARRGEIKKGEPHGWTHRVMRGDDPPLRFRVQSRTVQTLHGMDSIALIMRPIEDLPRPLSDLNLPPDVVDNLFPSEGLVLLSGPTGSGKTTILAAVEQEIARHPDGLVLATLEDPVEFALHGITGRTGFLTQAEKGRNFKDFSYVMRSLLRENPDCIVCGELRDKETIELATEACQTGHAVYGTVHTNSAAGTFSRMATKFEGDERAGMVAGLVDAARLFFHQRLYKRPGGGRVPIYEYVFFEPEDRIKLLEAFERGNLGGLTAECQRLVETKGLTLAECARQAFERGDLHEYDYLTILRSHAIETQQIQADVGIGERMQRIETALLRVATALESMTAVKEG